ncbi:multidrug transporter subunit MdtN [Burkholderia sp. Bp9125]|nr:multidrug transporter subunit MdtN [Burkholderia sp. Bp9125]
MRSKRSVAAAAIVLIAIALLGIVLWRLDHAPSTDDAYVYADTINVVPEVSGRIIDLPVRDNQAVRQGDLLFRIDPRPYQAALNQARARLDTLDNQIVLTQRTVNAQQYNADSVRAAVERARAAANQAAATLRRTEPLLAQGYVSAEEVDRARTAQRSAQAELNAAMLQAQQASAAVSGVDALVAQRAEVEAQIAIAELNLEFTEVRAPFDGRVVSLRTTVGQFASALKPVFTLIDTRHWYVVANFRETELKHVHAGTLSTVYLMSDVGRRFAGVVDSIGYGVLPDDGGTVKEGLPAVPRTINWVHVSQRFAVKIAVRNPDRELFRIGTSAVATLKVGDAAASPQ